MYITSHPSLSYSSSSSHHHSRNQLPALSLLKLPRLLIYINIFSHLYIYLCFSAYIINVNMSDTDNTGAAASGPAPTFTERELQMLGWAMQSLKSGPPEVSSPALIRIRRSLSLDRLREVGRLRWHGQPALCLKCLGQDPQQASTELRRCPGQGHSQEEGCRREEPGWR